MSKLPPEVHNVLGRVWGSTPEVGWAEPGHASSIEVCVEVYEGQRMAYVAGLDENGVSVRVDLDVEAWRRLSELASDVHERMAKAMREDQPDGT